MTKKCITFLVLLCFFVSNSLTTFAADAPYFTFHADKNIIGENDEIRIKVNASENNLKENIAAFRAIIHFDSSKLVFKRADVSSQMQDDAFQYHAQDDQIIGIYACDGKTAPKLLGDCITFVFKVKAGAVVGETTVSAQVDQIVDWTVHKLGVVCSDEVKLQIAPPLSPKALLASLEPLQGELKPNFSPDIAEYGLDLPYSADSIEFNAAAAEGGTVRINRKTLGKAGTKTMIIVTVISADKKSKSQYFVTVSRAEKSVTAGNAAVVTLPGKQSRTSSSNTQSKNQAAQATSQTGTNIGNETSSMAVAQGAGNQPTYQGDRNLYVIGNQMPTYVVGMLIACMCMLVGILALPFFKKAKHDR